MKYILLTIIAFGIISCKKEAVSTENTIVNDIKNNTEVAAKEGSGKMTLSCNGKQIIAEGVTGAIVTMGELMIVVKDKINPAKVFTISFNTDQFPENGKVYQIKPTDYSVEKKPENEVAVSFMEGLPNNKMNVWETKDTSGTLMFEVNGSEIKCTLKNIKLDPSPMFNADDLKQEATVSGQFTLYKN